MTKQSRRAFVSLPLILGVFLSTLILANHIPYRDLYPSSGPGLEFDSHSANKALSTFKELTPKLFRIKKVCITFSMKPYSFSGYPNVFQTAPSNDGIRMELNALGQAGFVVGHSAHGELNGCGPFALKKDLWNTIKFQVIDHRIVDIEINHENVLHQRFGGLHFDLSDVVVGTGFSKTRPFDGAIRDFRLQYQDPTWRPCLLFLQILFGCIAFILIYRFRSTYFAAIVSFDQLFSWNAISDVRHFLIKFSLLVIPVLIFLGKIEYSLHAMRNNYSQKREHFESHLTDMKLLILGSSNAFFGINPHFLSDQSYNVAYRAQAVYYDDQFIKRYLDRMPQLKVLIIPVDYLTFGTHQYEVDAPRAYLYQHYWNIPLEPRRGQGLDWGYRLDAKRFSLIAVYAERTWGYVANHYTESVDPDPDNTGWFDAGTQPCDVSLHIGPDGAKAHNDLVHIENFDQNAQLLQDVIERAKKRGVIPILVRLPLNALYTNYIDQAKWGRMQSILHTLAAKNSIRYLDYTSDDRFSLKDFTNMPDHMNALGAEKFTRILKSAITPELQSAGRAHE